MKEWHQTYAIEVILVHLFLNFKLEHISHIILVFPFLALNN